MIQKVSPYRLRALTLAFTFCCFAGGSAIAAPYFAANLSPSGNNSGVGDGAASSTGNVGMISWQGNPGQRTTSEMPTSNANLGPAPAWSEGYASKPAPQLGYGAYGQMQPPPQTEPVAYVPPPPGPYPVSPQELSQGARGAPQAEQHQAYGAAAGPMPYPDWGAQAGAAMPNVPAGYGPQSPYPPMPQGNPYGPALMPHSGMMPPGYAMQNGPAGYGAMPPASYPMPPRWAGSGPYGPPPDAYGPPPRGPYPPMPEMNGPAPYPAEMPPTPGYGPMPERYGHPPKAPIHRYPKCREILAVLGQDRLRLHLRPCLTDPRPPMDRDRRSQCPIHLPPPMASGPYGPPPWANGPWGPR